MARNGKNASAKYRARIARLQQLTKGFNRECSVVGDDTFLSPVEREAYLAAVGRVLRSLGEATQILVAALRRAGTHGS